MSMTPENSTSKHTHTLEIIAPLSTVTNILLWIYFIVSNSHTNSVFRGILHIYTYTYFRTASIMMILFVINCLIKIMMYKLSFTHRYWKAAHLNWLKRPMAWLLITFWTILTVDNSIIPWWLKGVSIIGK